MAMAQGSRAAAVGSRAMAALLAVCTTHPAQAAAEIGKAVSIAPSVSGTMSGQVKTMASGDGVQQDELIQTAAAGNARLRFIDATDFAIGPSSAVRLDRFVFNAGGAASSFVLNATRGAFRFVTGRSNHGAYEIRTPAAVIGVRGTQFSFTVYGTKLTLSVQQGRVIVCPIGLPRTSCVEASAGQTLSAQPNQPVVVSGAGGGRGPTPPGPVPPRSLPAPRSPQPLPTYQPATPPPARGGRLPPTYPSPRPPFGPVIAPPGDFGPYGPGGYGPGPFGPGGYGPRPYPPRGYYPVPGPYPPRGDGYPRPRPIPPRGDGYPPSGGGRGPSGGGIYGPGNRGGGAGPIVRGRSEPGGGPHGRGGPYGRGGGSGRGPY